MKLIVWLCLLTSIDGHAQSPVIYQLHWIEDYNSEKVTHFISLSDQYQLSEHEDSLAIPFENMRGGEGLIDASIHLKGDYRQRCLTATGISENDVVYIYDYANDKLLRFNVHGLNLIAVLSPYSYGSKYPIDQYEFMIGFEINPDYLNGFDNYYSHVLVSIGRTNPFIQGKMRAMIWTKSDSTSFPTNDSINKTQQWLWDTVCGDTYEFKQDEMTYFVQNLEHNGNLVARHVAVVQSKTNQVLFQQLYVDSEGGGPSMLNDVDNTDKKHFSQFTGQLFKNKPLVIFGFMYQSFGCSSIDFISENEKSIYINCDNRH